MKYFFLVILPVLVFAQPSKESHVDALREYCTYCSDDVVRRLQRIRCVITEVDDVLTDGTIYYAEDGGLLRHFHVRDQTGFTILSKAKIKTMLISPHTSHNALAKFLSTMYVQKNQKSQLETVRMAISRENIGLHEVAFVGNDTSDEKLIQQVGLFCCPRNAHPSLRKRAHTILCTDGGCGVIRDLADMICIAQSISPLREDSGQGVNNKRQNL